MGIAVSAEQADTFAPPVRLHIDGTEISATDGTTVLEAALAQGIYIPHLCHHPDLKPVGVCRLCMVEIEGRGLTLACMTPVADGMRIRTESPEIRLVRQMVVELLIANHYPDCLACSKNQLCQLQQVASYVGIDTQRLARLRRPERRFAVDRSNPFFDYDPNQCILCGICVRTCDEIVGVHALDYAFRGFATVVVPFEGRPIAQSACVSCGECVVRCPVGALVPKHFEVPAREVKTVCPYCGVGCTVYMGVRGNRIASCRADRESPVNHGRLCVKGRFGYQFVNHPDRLKKPLVRQGERFVEYSWEEALERVAEGFRRYRGDQIAVLASAKLTNEENYLLQKFARVCLGTNNIDHCARLCHAPSVAGLAQTLGSGAMTNSIAEIRHAACIFAIGTNTTVAHPVLAQEVIYAVRSGAELIVANPKEIELCRYATQFLQHRPGSDVALLTGMTRVIVEENLMDTGFIESRCENFDAFRQALSKFTPEKVVSWTGVPWEKIVLAARTYAMRKPGMILYAMGITQHSHGTDNVLAISNLALLTGNFGKSSSGVNPLRGQNNVQGACDMGALPNVLPGYQRVDQPAALEKFQKAWGCELSSRPGLTHTEMTAAAHRGDLRAMYIVGENPLISEADANHLQEALQKLEFLVVQDIFLTETAELADVVLPAACVFEKDGTVTNTERRIQRIRKAVLPPGEAQPDGWIISQIAQRLGYPGFAETQPSKLMEEIASLVPIYGGVRYERLENGGLQWPCPEVQHPGTPILHRERFATATGKARFVPVDYAPPAEWSDEQYPWVLTTDRSLFHYHTSTMTGRVEGLKLLHDREWIRIHPRDASKIGVKHGECIRLVSRRGEMMAYAYLSKECLPGVISATFHFPESPTNRLTHCAIDPVAKTPETKVCAVRIEKLPDGTL